MAFSSVLAVHRESISLNLVPYAGKLRLEKIIYKKMLIVLCLLIMKIGKTKVLRHYHRENSMLLH